MTPLTMTKAAESGLSPQVKRVDSRAEHDVHNPPPVDPLWMNIAWCGKDVLGQPADSSAPKPSLFWDKTSNTVTLTPIRTPSVNGTLAAIDNGVGVACAYPIEFIGYKTAAGLALAQKTANNVPDTNVARRLTFFPNCSNVMGVPQWSKNLSHLGGGVVSPNGYFDYVTFDTTQAESSNPCWPNSVAGTSDRVFFSIDASFSGPLLMAQYNDGSYYMPQVAPNNGVSSTSTTQSSTAVTTTTVFSTFTQAPAVYFTMPGNVPTGRFLSMGQATGDLLAASSLLLVGAGALALVTRRMITARRQVASAPSEAAV